MIKRSEVIVDTYDLYLQIYLRFFCPREKKNYNDFLFKVSSVGIFCGRVRNRDGIGPFGGG